MCKKIFELKFNRVLLVCICLIWHSGAVAQPIETTAQSIPTGIPVGLFVTSLYDLDFAENKYSMTGWVWALYCPRNPSGETLCPEQLPIVPEGYSFSNRIEIVNAREWSISPNEQYIIDNGDGSFHSMAKFTAVLHQQWEMSKFPFDKQLLNLEIESVEYESSDVRFVPDEKNSLVSNDFNLSGWRFSGPESHLQMQADDYVYPTSFGQINNIISSYPRMVINIPIEREGIRIFWTTFLGFFVSYLILSMLHLFNAPMIDVRVGLIMTALFASVGNKYTIDLLLPPQSIFTFADLIQYATFAIIAIGLLSTVMISRYTQSGREELATKINGIMFWLIIPVYPLVILYGAYSALIS